MAIGDMNTPHKELANNRGMWVEPLTFGRFRIGVGKIGSGVYDDTW